MRSPAERLRPHVTYRVEVLDECQSAFAHEKLYEIVGDRGGEREGEIRHIYTYMCVCVCARARANKHTHKHTLTYRVHTYPNPTQRYLEE